MRKLKDALKCVAVIGATMALALGMVAPATTALATDLAGGVPIVPSSDFSRRVGARGAR